MTKEIKSVKDELIELNIKFHQKSLLGDSFYNQLVVTGFAYRRCFLVSIFPDGSNTYRGQIIRQDGNVINFDIDLDLAELSLWENVTDHFIGICKNNNSSGRLEVIAYQLFNESIKSQSS